MIYFIVPVYNEEANLHELINNLKNSIKNHQKFYIFCDDGSSDDSINIINSSFNDNEFTILGDGLNHGPGNAFNNGFEWVLSNYKSNADKIVTIEADNTSDLKILPDMVSISELGFGLVLASVYAQGGGLTNSSLVRKLTSVVANLLLRFIFNINVLTLSSFYRVYTIQTIIRIKEKYRNIITENGFICMVEVLIKAIDTEASIIEVPMKLKSDNRIGKSKMKVIKTFKDYVHFLTKFSYKKRKYERTKTSD